jgi:hypothetical protein
MGVRTKLRGFERWGAVLLCVACGGKAAEKDRPGTSTTTGTGTDTGTATFTGMGTPTGTFTGTATFTMTGTGLDTGMETFTNTGFGTTTGADTGVGTYTPTVTSTGIGTQPTCAADVNVNIDAGAKVLSADLLLEPSGFTAEISVEQICQDAPLEPPTCLAPVVGTVQSLSISGAPGGTRRVLVAYPELPVDFFEAGETLTMVLDAWPYTDFFGTKTCQSLQLFRSGAPILFAHSCYGPSQLARLPSPNGGVPKQVTVGELTLTDGGVECTRAGGFCDNWYHSARVLLFGARALVGPGQTVAVGDYSFTLSRYRDAVESDSNCDFPSDVQFIAIAKP